MFLDNGLVDGYETKLYFPGDAVSAALKRIARLPLISALGPNGRVRCSLNKRRPKSDRRYSIIDRVFYEKGLRFVFSTRSKVPYLLKEDGSRVYGEGYKFTPGKDEIIRPGTLGFIVSYGEMLYRSLDAVERLREEGYDVGLINKSTLNVVDEDAMKMMGSSQFVLVAESMNQRTGLGSKVTCIS